MPVFHATLALALALSLPLAAQAQTNAKDDARKGEPAPPLEGAAPPERRGDTPIYGSRLMTPDERRAHLEQIRTAKTPEERDRLRTEHYHRMQERAKERGVSLPPPPPMRGPRGDTNPVYGTRLMTPEERSAYREQMRAAKTPEERQRLQAEHRKRMDARAKEKGVTVTEEPPTSDRRNEGK